MMQPPNNDGFSELCRLPHQIEVNATLVGDVKCYPKYTGTLDSFMDATDFMSVRSSSADSICEGCGTGMVFGIGHHHYSSFSVRMEMAREAILQLAKDPEQQAGIDPFAIDVHTSKLRADTSKPYKAFFKTLHLCPMCEYAQHLEYAGAKGAGQMVVLAGGLESNISQSAIHALTYQCIAVSELIKAIESGHLSTLDSEQMHELSLRLNLLVPALDMETMDSQGTSGLLALLPKLKEFSDRGNQVFNDLAGYALTAEQFGGAMTTTHIRYKAVGLAKEDDRETYEQDIAEVFLDQVAVKATMEQMRASREAPYNMPAKVMAATGGFDLGGAEYFGVLLQNQYFTFLEKFSQQALIAVRVRQPMPFLDDEGQRVPLPEWTQGYRHLRLLPDMDFWRPMVRLLLFSKYDESPAAVRSP